MPSAKLISIGFPTGGVNRNYAYSHQPPNTTPDAQNVRPYDPNSGRARGGQRAGLTRFLSAQANGSNRIQAITHTATYGAYGGVTTANSRTFVRLACSGGNLYTFTTSAFTLVGSGGELNSSAPWIDTTLFREDVFFADGGGYFYYDQSGGTLQQITASAGTLPADGSNEPRLCATFNNRLVYSGISSAPYNWFCSAVGDFTDWDYSPATRTATQAVAGNNGSALQIPDKVNTLIDSAINDVLIFGCDHGIYQCTGDPAAGGAIDLISTITGMAWGQPWCRDNEDLIYFFGSRGGVYVLPSRGLPQKITSGVIDEQLASVNLSTSMVKLVWDDRTQGVHVFISPLTAGATTHWFYDKRTKSWWKDVFANTAFNPVAVHVFDGDAEGDRVIFLGGEDGRIRYIDYDGTNDDTSAITSYCYLGPFNSSSYEDVLLTELQAQLGTSSSNVTCEVFAGETPEAAFNETIPKFTGVLNAGLCRNLRARVRGETLWLKLSNSAASQTWAFEQLSAKLLRVGGRLAKVRAS